MVYQRTMERVRQWNANKRGEAFHLNSCQTLVQPRPPATSCLQQWGQSSGIILLPALQSSTMAGRLRPRMQQWLDDSQGDQVCWVTLENIEEQGAVCQAFVQLVEARTCLVISLFLDESQELSDNYISPFATLAYQLSVKLPELKDPIIHLMAESVILPKGRFLPFRAFTKEEHHINDVAQPVTFEDIQRLIINPFITHAKKEIELVIVINQVTAKYANTIQVFVNAIRDHGFPNLRIFVTSTLGVFRDQHKAGDAAAALRTIHASPRGGLFDSYVQMRYKPLVYSVRVSPICCPF